MSESLARDGVFAIYDVKAEAYLRPFFEKTDATAIRAFASACADEAHEFRKHAEDYSLWRVGAWDAEKGLLLPQTNLQLATAFQFVASDLKEVAQ